MKIKRTHMGTAAKIKVSLCLKQICSQCKPQIALLLHETKIPD